MSRPAARPPPPDDDARSRGPTDPYASDPGRPATSALRPWWRWLFVLPGLAAAGYGAVGLLTAGGDVPLLSYGTWFIGSALLHDLVIAPVWALLGWLAVRLVPAPARPAVVVGAVVSGVLVLVSLPFVLGIGADPANPSFLPRAYGRNLLVLITGVLAVTALVAVTAQARAQRSARQPPDGDGTARKARGSR